ncbi:MAG TPA: MBL fold metallo-hydrolase, partial [Anaerolineales bacterium]|nr:MBL fold metallo-hydrolase [Anaerolineales bacterium]
RELGGAKALRFPLEPGPEPSILLDQFVANNRKLDIGHLSFDILFVPGHTLGHVAFYQKEAAALFGGDVLFQNSIGRTDFPGGNHDTLIKSIQTHFLSLSDSTIVYSGHGPETTIGAERQFNPYL